MQTIEDRLLQLGITLPPLPAAMANYVPFTLAGNLLYVSGQGPKTKDGDWVRGQVGKDLTVQQGYEAARLTGIQILAVANGALGSLSRVKRILKVNGFVNSGPEFRDHPAVINGCSDLFVELLGDVGRHARAAIGVSSLPKGSRSRSRQSWKCIRIHDRPQSQAAAGDRGLCSLYSASDTANPLAVALRAHGCRRLDKTRESPPGGRI